MESTVVDLRLNIKIADSFWSRLKGLLIHKEPITEEGLLITPCNSVHMFFMRFPIDVVFLDESNRVVKTVSELRPWKMVLPVRSAYSALELPAGTITKKNIKKGDIIQL